MTLNTNGAKQTPPTDVHVTHAKTCIENTDESTNSSNVGRPSDEKTDNKAV